jgi:hypothetical protein
MIRDRDRDVAGLPSVCGMHANVHAYMHINTKVHAHHMYVEYIYIWLPCQKDKNFITGQNEREETTQYTTVTKKCRECKLYKSFRVDRQTLRVCPSS